MSNLLETNKPEIALMAEQLATYEIYLVLLALAPPETREKIKEIVEDPCNAQSQSPQLE